MIDRVKLTNKEILIREFDFKNVEQFAQLHHFLAFPFDFLHVIHNFHELLKAPSVVLDVFSGIVFMQILGDFVEKRLADVYGIVVELGF